MNDDDPVRAAFDAILDREARNLPPGHPDRIARGLDHEPPEPVPDDELPLFSGQINWRAFWSRKRIEQDWLIEPLLPRGRSIALYAPAKAGKSLLALEVAAAASTGRRVLGQAAGPPIVVLYLDYEMTEDDLYERLSDLGYSGDDDLGRFHYFLSPQLAPLDTVSGGALVVAEATRIEASLIVIDTVARVISGEEQQSDTFFHLNRYLMNPLKNLGCTVLRIDHAGKDLARGQRNSSAKNDDVDVVWELTAGDDDTLSLRATHRRLPWVPDRIALTRIEAPLTHRLSTDAWPAGTAEAARNLDRLGADLTVSVRGAQTMLREGGLGVRQEVLRAALKYRREGVSREPGYTPPRVPPDTRPDTPHDDLF